VVAPPLLPACAAQATVDAKSSTKHADSVVPAPTAPAAMESPPSKSRSKSDAGRCCQCVVEKSGFDLGHLNEPSLSGCVDLTHLVHLSSPVSPCPDCHPGAAPAASPSAAAVSPTSPSEVRPSSSGSGKHRGPHHHHKPEGGGESRSQRRGPKGECSAVCTMVLRCGIESCTHGP